MKAIDICRYLGPERLDEYYAKLSAKEIRAVLKAGAVASNTPPTAFTQEARRKVWRKRLEVELGQGNEQLGVAFLIDWLMRHHRFMLVKYLDFLGVPHKQGETDEDFCETRTPEQLRDGAKQLLEQYPPHHVATYLLLVGHLQETTVFDETDFLLEALGVPSEQIAAHIAQAASARQRKAKAAS